MVNRDAAPSLDVPKPWDLTPDGNLRLRGPMVTAELLPKGLKLYGRAMDRCVAWESIRSLGLAIPTYRWWSRHVLIPLQYAANGFAMEPRSMWLYYDDGERHSVDLGRPVSAPFPKRVASSADEVTTVLSESSIATNANRLQLLGDAALGPAVIVQASSAYRRWDFFSIKGTRAVIDRIAPSQR